MDITVSNIYYYNQIADIDRQIEELKARKAAMLSGTCYIGYLSTKPYLDPYGLTKEEKYNGSIVK